MPPKKAKVDERVDTELYVIDRITDSKIVKNTILYNIKWEGYSKEYDSDEAEWRLTCDEKLIDYALSRIDPRTYIDRIEKMLGDYRNFAKDATHLPNFLDPIAILALTTVQCGMVKFVDTDTVTSRLLFLKYIRDSNQEYLLYSALIPSDDEIDRSERKYMRELKARLDLFVEHPLVKIIIPQEISKVFYSPPPLSNLIFEPVTFDMVERSWQYKDLFVPKSEELGFNRSTPFLDPAYFEEKKPEEDPLYAEVFMLDPNATLYKGMKRNVGRRIDPRFLCNLELQVEVGRGWLLRASHEIPKETPIIMMSGAIASAEFAHESLVRSGERIAFSSFIEIPGTGKCLDRRLYHDFTKYIPHSCMPTCSVRLVESGNEIPDLVVYSLVDINAANNFTISIDYYQGFKKEVGRFFWKNRHPDGKIFALYEKQIDFVHCQCLMPKCRDVLYVDRSLKYDDPSMSKTDKLQNLDPKFVFRGMSVVDNSNRIWKIREGAFLE